MKKINYLFIIFVLFLFVSCKSRKRYLSILPHLLNVDSVRPDSSAAIDGLFAPDHSQLADDLKVSTKKQRKQRRKRSCDRAGRT